MQCDALLSGEVSDVHEVRICLNFLVNDTYRNLAFPHRALMTVYTGCAVQ